MNEDYELEYEESIVVDDVWYSEEAIRNMEKKIKQLQTDNQELKSKIEILMRERDDARYTRS